METKEEYYREWYEIWMKQSEVFFATAKKNLSGMFESDKVTNPEDYMTQVNQWFEALKNQWQGVELTLKQQAYIQYWQTMTAIFNEAFNKMLYQWVERARENNPIKSIRELYEIWLDCCHEVYQKTIKMKSYQENYADFINTAYKFWKSAIPE